MKAILYVIAIVAIAAGAWFSNSSKAKFQELKDAREKLDAENETRRANIKEAKDDANTMEAELKSAKATLADSEASRDNTKNNLQLAKKQAAEWNSKIAGQKEKLEGTKNLIVQVKKAFAELGNNVELDEIPGLVQKLEDELKADNKKLEELQSHG